MKFQISLQRLFASTAIIAVGCGAMAGAWRVVEIGLYWPTILAVMLHVLGAMAIGTGLGNIFKYPIVGLVYGGAVGMLTLVMLRVR